MNTSNPHKLRHESVFRQLRRPVWKKTISSILLVQFALWSVQVQGATGNWVLDNSGNWTGTPANWQSGIIPNAAGDFAIFRNNLTGNRTITLNAPITLGGLRVGDSLGGSTLTFAGSAVNTLTLNSGSADNAVVSQYNSATTTWQAPLVLGSNTDFNIHTGTFDVTGPSNAQVLVSGSGNIIKNGAGTLRLNLDAATAPGYTGNFVVNFGTLNIGGANGATPTTLGSGTGGIILNGWARQDLAIFSLNNNGAATDGTVTYSGNNNVTVQGGATINVDRNYIGAANDRVTHILNNLQFNGGVLRATSANSHSLQFNGTTTLSGQTNVLEPLANVTATRSNLILNGPITDGDATSNLIKEGAGRLAINGTTNSYDGITVVKNGILQLGAGANLGAGKTYINGGTLSVPDMATLNSLVSSTGGLALVGQLGTSRYALPVIGYSGSADINSGNPLAVNVPVAGMVLGIDGISGTSSTNTANIDLSQVGSGSNRVWLANVIGFDRTYNGNILPSGDNTIRLSSPSNILILSGAANQLGGASSTANLIIGHDISTPINYVTAATMTNAQGGTVSVRSNNALTGTVTVHRGVTANITGTVTTPLGTGPVVGMGGTISTDNTTTAQFGNTDFRLFGGTTLLLDNSAVASANVDRRLLNTTNLDLTSSTLRLLGDGGAATASSQAVSSIDYTGGSTISVDTDGTVASRLTTLTTGTLNRVARGTLNIRNIANTATTFGSGTATQKLIVTTTAPTPVNGMIGADIALWGGANSNDGQAPLFATYDSNGVKAASFNLTSTLTGATTASIVDYNATAYSGAGASIQALRILSTANTHTFNASSAMTLGSAAGVGQGAGLFLSHTANNTITHTSGFNFGTQEGLIYASTNGTSSIIVLSGVLAGSNGITRFGDGLLRLQGVNTFTGPLTLNAGETRLNGIAAAGGTATAPNDINIYGGSLFLEAANTRYYANVNVYDNARFSNVNVAAAGINNLSIQPRTGSTEPVVINTTANGGSNVTTVYGSLNMAGPGQFHTPHVIQINGGLTGTGELQKFGNERIILLGDASGYSGNITSYTSALVSYNSSSSAKPFGTGNIVLNPGAGLTLAAPTNINASQVTMNSDLGGISYIGQLYVADPATTLPGFTINSSSPTYNGGFGVGAVGFDIDIDQTTLFGGNTYLGGPNGYTGVYTGNLTPATAGYLLGASQGAVRISKPLTGNVNAILGVSMTDTSSRADVTVNNSGGGVTYDVPMTYTGNTILNPGTYLRISAKNALVGTGDVIFAGGQLRADPASAQLRMLPTTVMTNNVTITSDTLIQMENSAYDFRIGGNIRLGPGSTGVVRSFNVGVDQPGGAQNNAGMVYLDGGVSDGASGSLNQFNKVGPGVLFFTGPNTYTGATTISQGLIGVNGDADWGNSTGAINIPGGGIAVWENSFTTSRNYSMHGGNAFFDIGPGLSLTQASTSTMDGTSFLIKRGIGTMVLNGSNSQTGLFLADGVLQVNAQESLGNPAESGGTSIQFSGDQTLGGATAGTRYTGGTLRLNFTGATNRGITFNNNANTAFSGGVDVTGTNIFTINGVISQGSELDTAFKTGSGTLFTAAANTWRSLAMTNGRLQFNNSTPWANSTATAADVTTLEMLGGTIHAQVTTANISLTNQASTTTYNYGGGMHLRFEGTGSFSAELAADNLLRQNQGTLVIETVGTTALGVAGTNAGRLVAVNAIAANLARASALNNGIFAPHLLGADSSGSAFFLENDATNGFKAYSGSTLSSLAGGNPAAIGNITSDQTLTGSNSIYAFRTTADVSGGTLSIPAVNMLKTGGIAINASKTLSSNLVFSPEDTTAATSLTGASTTADSPTVTVASTTGLVPGMAVFGPNIRAGTTILSINSATGITLSQTATAAGSSLTLSAQNGSAAASGEGLLYVKTGEVANITGNVTANLLTKFGAGTLVLDGSNMVAGDVSVQDGTLRLANNKALSRMNSELNINAGATLDLAGNFIAVETVGGNNRQVALSNVGGSITSSSPGATLMMASPISSAYNGTLNLDMKLVKAGAGVLTINGFSASTPDAGNNTYTGGTDIYGTSAAVIAGGATTNGSAAVTVASTQGLAAGMIITGTGINANTYITSITGPTTFNISQNATATNTGLTFTSVGGLTLNNAAFGLGGYNGATAGDVNLYSGNFNLFFSNGTTGVNGTQGQQYNNQVIKIGPEAGDGITLNVRGPGTMLVNQGLVSSNGTFGQGNIIQFGALNMTNTTLNLAGGSLYRLRAAGPINILGSQAAFQSQTDGPSGALELTGVISGNGALTKLGDGTLRGIIISNPGNTYSGGTNIVGGDVQVTATSGSALGAGPIRVFPDGTLRIAANGSIDGSKLSVMSRITAMGAVVLDDNFNPSVLNSSNFSSIYNTSLQLGQSYFTTALDLATIADGRAFLGAGLFGESSYMAATLGAGLADSWNPGVGVYRIAPGTSSLALPGVNNVLTGTNYLQVGPRRNMVVGTVVNGGNVLVIRNSNNFTEGTQIASGASVYIETGGRATGETPLGVGAVEVYGELRVRGAQGSLWNAATSSATNAINLRPGGVIRMHDADGAIAIPFLGAGGQGRWGDSVALDLNGGTFIYNGGSNMQSSETIGAITARKGGQLQAFRSTGAAAAQLNVGDISRAERGVLTLAYNSGFLGINTTSPLSYERITADTIDGAAITRSGTTLNGSGAVNGGMVAPWIIDRTTNSFVGYDPTSTADTGFQPLISSATPGAGQIAYNKIASGALTAGGLVAGDIADITTAAKTLADNPTLYAMRSNQNISVTGSANTITLSSGGLILTGGTWNPVTANVGIVNPMTVNFGNAGAGEAFIFVGAATSAMYANINAAQGLTKFGPNQLSLLSINPGIGSDVVINEGTLYTRAPFSGTGAAVGQALNSQNVILNAGALVVEPFIANAAGTYSEIASSVRAQALFDSDIFVRGSATLGNNGQAQYVQISDLTIGNSAGSTAMNGNGVISLSLQSGIWVRGTTTLSPEAKLNATFNGLAQSTFAGPITGTGAVEKFGNGTITFLNGSNDYAGGTIIWGTTNATATSIVASGLRGSGTPFGAGDIQVQPGGLLRFADNANIASNISYVRSDAYGLGGIGIAHNSTLPDIISTGTPTTGQIKVESTGPYDGVLALDYGYFSQTLNPATIAGGKWWIGNSQQSESYYFNGSIGASAGGKYLLGGGGNQSSVNFGAVSVSSARTPLYENLFSGGTADTVRIEVGAQTGDFAWNSPSFVNGNGFANLMTRNTGLVGDVRVNTNSTVNIGNNFALGNGRLILNGGTFRVDFATTTFGNSNNFVTNNIVLDNDVVLQGDWSSTGSIEFVLNGNVAMSDVLTAGATRTWTLGNTSAAAVGLTSGSTTNGVISGAPGSNIIKAGAQVISFRGNNTYQGFTQINAGQIIAVGNVAPNVAGALGNSDSPVTLAGGSLGIGGKFEVSRDILVNNSGTIEARTNETAVISSGISIAAGAVATLGGLGSNNGTGQGGALVISGPISGGGAVTFGTASAVSTTATAANGPVVLGSSNGYGINTYAGGTTFNSTRVEITGSTYVTGPASNPVIISGPFGTGAMTWTSGENGNGPTFLAVGGARTVENPFNATSSAANATYKFMGNQALTFTRPWDVSSDGTVRNRTFQVSNPYQPVTFSGNLSNSGANGSNVLKTGSGLLIFTGANTFANLNTADGSYGTGVFIDDGILRVNGDAALGSTNTLAAAGSHLAGPADVRLRGGYLSVTNGFTTARQFILTSSNGGVDVAANQTLTLTTATAGAFGIRKVGLGTLALNNTANTINALTLGGGQQLNPAIGFTSATGGTVSTTAISGTPLTTGTATLNSGTLALVGGASAQSLAIPTVAYGPAGAISVNMGSTSSQLTVSTALSRSGAFNSVNYGTLVINPSSLANLGSTEKVVVTTGAPGNTTLGAGTTLTAPNIFVALPGSGQNADFARYDSTNGFMAHNATTSTSLAATAPATIGDISSAATVGAASNDIIDVYGLRTDSNISGFDSSVLLRINGGGLILNGAAGPVISSNLLFGTGAGAGLKEAVVYVRDGQTGPAYSAISGNISALDFTKTGPGTLEVSGASNILNTNAARLPVVSVQNGSFRFASSGAQFVNGNRPAGVNAFLGNYVLNVNESGIFDMNGLNTTVSGLNGNGTVTSNVAGAVTLTISNGFGVDTTFSGALTNGSGTVGLTKSGNGVLTLTGYGSYSGGTVVQAGRVTNATGSPALQGGRVEAQTVSALGIGPITIAGGDLRLNGAALLDGTQTTSEVVDGIDVLLYGGPNGYDVTIAANTVSNGLTLPSNTTSNLRAASQNALIGSLTINAPVLNSTEGLIFVKGATTFSQENTILRTAGGRLFLQGQVNAGTNTITKIGANDVVVSNTESGAGQNTAGLWKVYGGILNARSATGAANPLGLNPTVELNGSSTSYGLLLSSDGDGTAAAETITTFANTNIRFGNSLPVSSVDFVSSSASRLATDRVLGNNDDKTFVVNNVEARGVLGSAFAYFLTSNSSSLWINGTTTFDRDFHFQADGTAVTFNGPISGSGTLSRRSNGATVYFNSVNTYDGGTFLTGGGRNLFGSYEGNQVNLSNTAKLGTGHVFLGTLSMLQINDAGNLRSDQNIYVGSNLSFGTTLSLAANLSPDDIRLRALGLGGIQNGSANYYLSATNPSAAILALGTLYDKTLDMRSLGDGMWFLGSATNMVGANGSYDAASLAPGLSDTYRLGAGGATLFFGSNGNANILTDVNAGKSASLMVGAPMTVQNAGSWSGGSGTIVLMKDQNYTGATTVNRGSVLEFRGSLRTSGMDIFGTVNVAGEAGTFINPATSSNIPVTLRPGSMVRLDNLSGVLPASATEGRWGDSTPFNFNNSVLRLQGNPAVEVSETVGAITSGAGANRVEVVRGVIGRGTQLVTPSISRSNFGTLQFVHNGSQLGSDERVMLSGGAPTVTNGMVDPWMISSSDVQFLTYNANTGFTIAGFDVVHPGGTNASSLAFNNNRVIFSTAGAVLGTGTDVNAWGLRLDQDVTLQTAAANTATTNRIILGSGGLISNGTRTIRSGLWGGTAGTSELLLFNSGTTAIGEFANIDTAGQIRASGITKFGAGTLQFLGNNAGFNGDIRLQQGAVELNWRNVADVATTIVPTTIGGDGGNIVFQGAGTTLNLRAGTDGTGVNFTGNIVSFNKGLVLADNMPVAFVNVDRSGGTAATSQTKTVILGGGITYGSMASGYDVGQILRLDLRNIFNLAIHGTTTLNGRSSLAVEDAAYGNTGASTVFLRGQVTEAVANSMLIKGPSDSKSRILELDYVNGLNNYTGGTVLQGGTLRVMSRSANVANNTVTNITAGGLGNGTITLMQGSLDLRVDGSSTGAADGDTEFVRYSSSGTGANLVVNGSTTINADRSFYTGSYSRTSGTVTATIPGGHNFTVGQSIAVSTGPTAANFTLTAVTPTTITYTDGTATSTGLFVATNNSGTSKVLTFNSLTIGSQALTLTGGNSYSYAIEGNTTLQGNTMLNLASADLILGGAAGTSGTGTILTDGGAVILNKFGANTLWIHSANPGLNANVYVNAGLLAFGNRAVGNTTANLGVGDIFVNPGAAVQVRAMANINTGSGQQVVLTGTPYAPSLFRSAFGATQANLEALIQPRTTTSNEVTYISWEGTPAAANYNQSTIGDGRVFFGAIAADRTYTGAATGSALTPGLANIAESVVGGSSTNRVYRLGGGDTTARTLNINLTVGGLNDFNSLPTDLQVGSLAILGPSGNFSTGFVYLQDQNTYTGQTVVSRGNTLRFNQAMATGNTAGPLGANGSALIDIYGGLRFEGTGSLFENGSTTSHFYTNLNLHPTSLLTFQDITAIGGGSNRWADNIGIRLDGSSIAAEATTNVDNNAETIGAVVFDRGSRIALQNEGTGDVFLTVDSIGRASAGSGTGTGRGTLVFTPTTSATFGVAAAATTAQTQFKFSGTAPTTSATAAVSGMLPGFYMESNGQRFVKLGANGVTPVLDADMVAMPAGAGVGSEVVNVTATASMGSFETSIFALRGGNVTLNSPTGANNDATITLTGSGADIGAVAATASTFTINPNLKFGSSGTNEAIFYTGGNIQFNGNLTAGSVTKYGTSTLVIGSDQSDAARGTGNGYSGGWVVNEGALQFSQFGSGGNAVPGNTIVLNGSQAGSGQLNLRAQPADNTLINTYSFGKIYAVDFGTIDWDPGANDRVNRISDIEIQQSGGIDAGTSAANSPINGTVDAYLRVAVSNQRNILSAGTLTLASNSIVNVDATLNATTLNSASYTNNAAYLTNSISSGLSVDSLVGANRLTKWGDGTLYIRGDSSSAFSGSVVIDQGAVFVANHGSLGTGAVTVNRYGVLEVGVANYNPTNTSITYNEGSIERWSIDSARSGNVDLGKATLQVGANQANTTANITLNGGGIQAYANGDGHSNAQSSGGVLRILPSTVTFNLTGNSFLGDRFYEGANGLDSGKQVMDFRPMEEYLASGAILDVQGVISGNAGLTKVGFDTVMLSAQNTYTGATVVTGGKLMIGTDNALPQAGTVTTTSNAVLDLNGQNQTIGVLNNLVTTTAVNTTSGFITNAGTSVKTLTVGNTITSDFTYSGVIQHNVALTMAGTGVFTLNNVNTYFGATTLTNGGSVKLGANANIADSVWLNIGASSKFDVTAKTTGSGNFVFDGRVSGGGTSTAGSSFASPGNAARIDAAGGTFTIGDNVGEVSKVGFLAPGGNSTSSIATAGNQIGHVYVNGNLTVSGPVTGSPNNTTVDRVQMQLNGSTANAGVIDPMWDGTTSWLVSNAPGYLSGTQGTINNHDYVNVSGELKLNQYGRVTVSNFDTYTPVYGDVFNLFDWTTLTAPGFDAGTTQYSGGTSAFDLQLPNLSAYNLLWDTSLFMNYGTLVVVPEPGRALLMLLGLMALFMRRRRQD